MSVKTKQVYAGKESCQRRRRCYYLQLTNQLLPEALKAPPDGRCHEGVSGRGECKEPSRERSPSYFFFERTK